MMYHEVLILENMNHWINARFYYHEKKISAKSPRNDEGMPGASHSVIWWCELTWRITEGWLLKNMNQSI